MGRDKKIHRFSIVQNSFRIKNGKTQSTNWGNSMTEFEF